MINWIKKTENFSFIIIVIIGLVVGTFYYDFKSIITTFIAAALFGLFLGGLIYLIYFVKDYSFVKRRKKKES